MIFYVQPLHRPFADSEAFRHYNMHKALAHSVWPWISIVLIDPIRFESRVYRMLNTWSVCVAYGILLPIIKNLSNFPRREEHGPGFRCLPIAILLSDLGLI